MQMYRPAKWLGGLILRDKLEFAGMPRRATRDYSLLKIFHFLPDTVNHASNRAVMLDNCQSTSHELSPRTARQTVI